MFVVQHRNVFFALTAAVVALAIGAVALFGLNLGIDFTGGAITEVSYPPRLAPGETGPDGRPDKVAVEGHLRELGIGGFSLRPTGEDGFILRTKNLTEEERLSTIEALALGGSVELTEDRFNSIGPVIGNELRNKALVAIGIVVVAIVLFVAFVFRHVSAPVSSWKYGLVAILALLHDVIVPVGVFAVLGALLGAEVDVLFVMALLAILGYSVNDTIVVFDRVRENLRCNEEAGTRERFDLTVGKSLNQTYVRSINTSLTTVFVLLTLFFLGAPITRDFALVLLTGVAAGTYSSIFLAAPLLVAIGKKRAVS